MTNHLTPQELVDRITASPLLYTSLIGSGDWEWTGGEASTGAFVGRITPGRQSLALITATLGPLT